MTRTMEELTAFARKALEADGISKEYLSNLSTTWNALDKYLTDKGAVLNRETGVQFLYEVYGVQSDQKPCHDKPINKRRRRALNILFNSIEHGTATPSKDYAYYLFEEPFSTPFQQFMNERKQSNLSFATIHRDITTLNKLSKFWTQSGITALSMVDGAAVIGFMKWCSASGKLPTLKSVASSFRLLLKYLHQNAYLEEDYSTSVPKVKVERGVPSVYNSAEIEKMLSCFNRKSKAGIRNYAMVLLAVRLGMRASDICNLKLPDICWDRNTIEFSTKKTGHLTVLPLTSEIGNAIIEHLKKSRPQTNYQEIFIRLQPPSQFLKPSVLHSIVTQAFHDAGVVIPAGKRHGPHALRASLASEMLQQNVSLSVISETLSHANTDTTKIYLKIDFDHLRKISLDVPNLDGVWMGGVPV